MASSGAFAPLSSLFSGKPKNSITSYDLNDWKWEVLYNRRIFLMPLINLFLTLVWAFIFSTNYYLDIVSGSTQVVFALSCVLTVIHAFNVALLLTKSGLKYVQYVDGMQGNRMCSFSVLSSLIAIIILLLLDLNSEYYEPYDVMLLTSAISVSIFEHIGLHHICSFFIFAISCACVIIKGSFHAKKSPVDPTPMLWTCLLILGEYLLYSISAMQHADYKHRFSQSQELHKSRSERVNQLLLLPDLLVTLNHLDEAMTGILPVSLAEKSSIDNQWRWTKEAAILQVQRFRILGFKYSLSGASTNADDNTPVDENAGLEQKSCFFFFKTCKNLFAMLEASLGCSLPLFIDEDATEISIIGNQEIFEVMIFYLIYESVYMNKNGLCKISCDNDPEMSGTWIFTVSVTSDHSLDFSETAKNKFQDEGFDVIPTGLFVNDEAVVGKSTTWTRFAHIIAIRHLNACKWQLKSEHNGNFKTLKHIFKIKDNCVSADSSSSASSNSDSSEASALKHVKSSFVFVNDIESFSSMQKCLEILHIPFHSCVGHELKNFAKKVTYYVAIIHETQLKTFEELNVDLPNLAYCVIVLFDSNNILNVIDKLSQSMRVKRIRVGESVKNIFERIREIIESLNPRPMVQVDDVKKLSVGSKFGAGRAVSNSMDTWDNSTQQWLRLLEKFDYEVKNGCPNIQYYFEKILYSIEACKNRFESEESKSDVSKVLAKIESEYPNFPQEFEPKQKIAKVLVEKFLGNDEFQNFLAFLKNNDYNEMKELCTIYIRRANDFHQRRLSCWFTCLHDVCGIMHSHFSTAPGPSISRRNSITAAQINANPAPTATSLVEFANHSSKLDGSWREAKPGLTFDEKINRIIMDMINLLESSIWRIVAEG